MENKEIVVICSVWDTNDYIISLRPETVEPWLDKPVGMTVNKANGEIIRRWLQENWIPLREALNTAVRHIEYKQKEEQTETQTNTGP